MEVTGKIIVKLPAVSGVSKAGSNWSKQEYVLETQEAYPKKVFFDFFGERANQYSFEVGDTINLSFDVESREYNGRWYTSIRGWKAEKVQPGVAPAAAPAPTPAPAAAPAAPAPAPFDPMGPGLDGPDDLPF